MNEVALNELNEAKTLLREAKTTINNVIEEFLKSQNNTALYEAISRIDEATKLVSSVME